MKKNTKRINGLVFEIMRLLTEEFTFHTETSGEDLPQVQAINRKIDGLNLLKKKLYDQEKRKTSELERADDEEAKAAIVKKYEASQKIINNSIAQYNKQIETMKKALQN